MKAHISLCIAATVAFAAGCSSIAPDAAAGGPPAGAARVFRQLDANGDGFVSRQEAMRNDNVARSFDAADRNGDGKLDREEFSTLPAY